LTELFLKNQGGPVFWPSLYRPSGHGHLCVCLSLAAFPHYCTDPDVTWGNGRRGL